MTDSGLSAGRLASYCGGIIAAGFVIEIAVMAKITAALLVLTLLFSLLPVLPLLPLLPSRALLYRRSCLFLLIFTAGMFWHLCWATNIRSERISSELEGVDLLSRGYVIDIPSQGAIAQQFRFRIEQGSKGFEQRTVLLNYYGDEAIEPGQRWQFLLRLNRPHGLANPGTYDYEARLFQQGISAKGYIRRSDQNQLLALHTARHCTPWRLCNKTVWNQVRFRLRSKITAAMTESDVAGMVLALSLGDRSGLDAAAWERFARTGTSHLFVVSGLHIGMVAGLGFYLGNFLLRLFPWLFLYFPRQKLAAMMAITLALAYSLLAGFTMPTQRALIMISVFMWAYIFNRRSQKSISYFLALALVLSVNPLSFLGGGFWFSFLAVGVLLIGGESGGKSADKSGPAAPRDRFYTFLLGLIKPQLRVFLALAVPLIFFTSQFSLISPLVNFIAIPLLALLVLPLCLLAMVLLYVWEDMAVLCYQLLDWVLTVFTSLLQWVLTYAGGWSAVTVGQLTGLSILLAAFVSILLLLPRGLLSVQLKAMLLLLYTLALVFRSQHSEYIEGLRVDVFDVGQGLSVLVRTGKHQLVYDVGARLSEQFDSGSLVVAPALISLGVRQLDTVVISHADNDHSGGLEGLTATIPASRIYSNDALLPAYTVCREGDSWRWNGFEFRFLHPAKLVTKENNNSCVLQVSKGEFSLLLPGDIEASVERQLALSYGDELRSNILIAPHHGSKTSSSFAFLKRVLPEYVVYPAGYRNSFGHPDVDIQQRYQLFGAQALATAESGMISFFISPEGLLSAPQRYRVQNPRYWY